MSDHCNAEKLAKLLDLDRGTVYSLVREGHIPKEGKGRYHVAKCVNAYCKYVHQLHSSRGGYAKRSNLGEEKTFEEVRRLRLANNEVESKLVPVDDFRSEMMKLATHVARVLDGLPAAVKIAVPELPAVGLDEVDRQVVRALQGVGNFKKDFRKRYGIGLDDD